jgi:uncharacterized membrane protein SpoIIM required for sporulation
MALQREEFVRERRARWSRFEELSRRAGRSLGNLDGQELMDLGRLYRVTTADLATARRDFPRDPIVGYLNVLVSRAHPQVYQERVRGIRAIGRFVRYGFPEAYRLAGKYTVAAFACFAGAALVSALLVAVRPDIADTLIPGEAQTLRSIMQQHHLWIKSATENHSAVANFIMLNNIQVAFIAFAFGMLAGVGTVWVMLSNGVSIGAVSAMVAQYGLSGQFWAFVVPHGVIELSVIFMAGGAGMMIGDAILRPGLKRRSQALVDAARNALAILAGCVPLLIIAGMFEGFLDPSDVADWVKFAIAAVNFVALYSYLLLSRPKRIPASYRLQDVLEAS